MGLKKIAALRAELETKADSLSKFKEAADEFVETYDSIRKAYDDVEKLRENNLSKVEAIKTLGIPEFEAYKRSLVSVYKGWGVRPLPTKPLEMVVKKQRDAVHEAVMDRIDKLAATFPKTLKAGMVFKWNVGGKLVELKGEERESTNPNLKGDAKLWWDTVDTNGSTGSVNVAELKKSYKYIKDS